MEEKTIITSEINIRVKKVEYHSGSTDFLINVNIFDRDFWISIKNKNDRVECVDLLKSILFLTAVNNKLKDGYLYIYLYRFDNYENYISNYSFLHLEIKDNKIIEFYNVIDGVYNKILYEIEKLNNMHKEYMTIDKITQNFTINNRSTTINLSNKLNNMEFEFDSNLNIHKEMILNFFILSLFDKGIYDFDKIYLFEFKNNLSTDGYTGINFNTKSLIVTDRNKIVSMINFDF